MATEWWYEVRYRSFGWRWLKALLFDRSGWLRWAIYTEMESGWSSMAMEPPEYVPYMPPLRRIWVGLVQRNHGWGRSFGDVWRTYRDPERSSITHVSQRFTREAVRQRERGRRDFAQWQARQDVIRGALEAGGVVPIRFIDFSPPIEAHVAPGGWRKGPRPPAPDRLPVHQDPEEVASDG